MIRRLLVANRGEIAVRIVRASRELGIESVAVYSECDAETPHTVLADHAERLGSGASEDSYLSIPSVIDAARRSGADAVHPGYGFLAENAAFAAACVEAGLVFVGPPSDVIARMGSKVTARRLMADAGVATVPGREPEDQTKKGLQAAADSVGYPVLVKASAGGGGKGMRAVREPGRLAEALDAARRESQAAFGDGTLYIERLIERPRHVEVQVLADGHGNVVHLFERECSIQRRHQKIIEESPSCALTPALRARMGEAAVAAARASRYVNAGTIEFLVDGSGDAAQFYFLEMNTRLQVEHPVTEAVTGVDLVRAQIAVASGEVLPWRQDDLTQRGHAIECRVYAEDPASGFLPQAGRLLLYREPTGPGIRVDSGVVEGSDIPVQYDPLIAKLIVHGETRAAALDRAVAALRRFPVLGLSTNIPFLVAILDHPRFRTGDLDTGFIEAEAERLTGPHPPSLVKKALAAAVAVAGPALAASAQQVRVAGGHHDPWSPLGGGGR